MITLAGLRLADPEGRVVAVEGLLERPDGRARWLVIQAMRYYG